MDVRIKALHFDASQRLVDFINRKAERLAHRNPGLTLFDVTLKVVKPETAMNKEVVLRINIPTVGEKVVTKTADTFEEAFDTAVEAIDRQLQKVKE